MEKLLTSKELAEAIGASESSMRRWTNSGVIRTARTVGGHRRIAVSDAIRFVRETGSTIIRPDLLGLPELPATASGGRVASHSLESHLHEALRSGDATAAKGCVAGLFLSGLSVASICDGAIRNAMRQIGELWHEDPRGILVEHRAMSICTQALEVLRQMISEPANDAPVALGGAPAGDPYLLPSIMAASVLAEAGYRDVNYGPETPLELLATAAVENKACIVWLSIKVATDRPKLKREVSELAKRLGERGIKLVVGGHGVESLAFRSTKNLQVMQTMSELSAFARGMVSVKDEQNSAPADIAKAIK